MDGFKGLSRAEVEASRQKHGTNSLTERERKTFWQKYWEKFDDPIIVILLAALGINIVFTFFGKVDWFECVGVFLSILISTLVSALSEYKNEEAFRTIQAEASRTSVRVFRGGALVEVWIDELVRGDLVLLRSGDLVPADGHVLSGAITVDQSALNGEKHETEKTAAEFEIAERSRLIDFWDSHSLFRGSEVCSGECVMKTDEVGDGTVYGRLSREAQSTERKSPLQVKLAGLARSISRFGYIGSVLVVLICMFQKIVIANGFDYARMATYLSDTARVISDFVGAVTVGITLIVVAVPEGLPLMIAIVCSLNMKKMMESKVLVRKLIGIETAGSINMLFTDKTGTITCGKLKAVSFTDGAGREFASCAETEGALRRLICATVVGSSSAYKTADGKVLSGNATEKALLEFVAKSGTGSDVKLSKKHQNLFDSGKKFSSATVFGDFCGTVVKGAPEVVLKKCTGYIDSEGKVRHLASIHELSKVVDGMAARSMRVLALAVGEETVDGRLPSELSLVGLVALRDELRPDVKAAVGEVRRAGIQTVMITGDKKETAVAIAKEAGISDGFDEVVLTSEELGQMSDNELARVLPRLRVIARALPTDKGRLVRVAQENGFVVGMTGDGVNDLAALRLADVGFSMGSGSDAAKEAGDIVILDDNFSSVRKAVLYGRTIYRSIKKFITFQLTINIAALSVSLLGPMIGMEKPLNITQMLWINLVMDTLAAIAFGGEPALARYMLEKPKARDEKITDRRMWSAIASGAMFIFAMSLFLFVSADVHRAFRSGADDIYFRTGYFSFFIFSCIFNAFNARTDGIDLMENISLNKPFIVIMLLICVVQTAMTYFGGAMLKTVGLSPTEWVVSIVPALLIIPLDILRKMTVGRG